MSQKKHVMVRQPEETTRHRSYNAACVLYEVGNESEEKGDNPIARVNDPAWINNAVCSL
jgi:hypothetical protein